MYGSGVTLHEWNWNTWNPVMQEYSSSHWVWVIPVKCFWWGHCIPIIPCLLMGYILLANFVRSSFDEHLSRTLMTNICFVNYVWGIAVYHIVGSIYNHQTFRTISHPWILSTASKFLDFVCAADWWPSCWWTGRRGETKRRSRGRKRQTFTTWWCTSAS